MSSRLHPASVQTCCRYVLAGHPTLARPCEGVHRRTSLTSSSLLLQQCPACMVRLIWMMFEMGGRWPYNNSFVRCSVQDLFNIAHSILAEVPSSLVSVHVVHPCRSIDTTAAWKKCVLFYRIGLTSDFHMTDSLLVAVLSFARRVLISFSVDETLFPR